MNFEIQAPEKAVYKFNEITSLTGVKPYVLRFWETEFSQIQPNIDNDGHKIYRPEDLEIIHEIKELLFKQKLSIPEAKAILDNDKATEHDDLSNEASSMESRAQDLKVALEQIIDKNSRPENDGKSSKDNRKADLVVEKVKKDIRSQTQLADKDIINLVSAKKKLTILLKKIDKICEEKNW